jgi:ribosomal protein S18 acetylase RimI-like enzyme
VDDEEVVGFGAPSSESLFADVSKLTKAWRAPNRADSREVFVAEVDGQVAGCVTLEDANGTIELIDVDVPRSLQRQGIGTSLARFVEELARERGKRTVTLGTSRNAAGTPWKSFPWWVALGYTVTYEEENEWTRSIGPGAREIRMRKDVREQAGQTEEEPEG